MDDEDDEKTVDAFCTIQDNIKNVYIPRINLQIAINLETNECVSSTTTSRSSSSSSSPNSSAFAFNEISPKVPNYHLQINESQIGNSRKDIESTIANLPVRELTADEVAEFKKLIKSPRQNLVRLEEFGRQKNLDIKPHLRNSTSMFNKLIRDNEIGDGFLVVNCIERTFQRIREHCHLLFSHQIDAKNRRIQVSTTITESKFCSYFSQFYESDSPPPTLSCFHRNNIQHSLTLIEILPFLCVKN